MLSHLHKCFDARLISIHPETHLIRAFVNYDVITDFHGQKATLPRNIDKRALQHHWDMCCLENSPDWSVPRAVGSLTNTPELPSPSLHYYASRGGKGDPSKGSSQQAPDTEPPDTQPPDTQPVSETKAGPDTRDLRTSCQASGATALPPSPPPSERAPEGRTLWRMGHTVIEDPARAGELARQGQKLVSVNDDDIEGSDDINGSDEKERSPPWERRKLWRFGRRIVDDPDEAKRLRGEGWILEVIYEGRGRSRVKRRCVSTEEDAQGHDQDGAYGLKKQRLG